MDVMALRRNIITGNHRLPFRERTVVGNPVSFRTNADKPLNELLIPFLPIQQGTGDPSLENIRHINGWQGLTAFRGVDQTDYDSYPVTFPAVGKNLFGDAIEQGTYRVADGIKGNNTKRVRAANGTFLQPGTYTISCTGAEKSNVFFYDENDAYIGVYNESELQPLPLTFTLDRARKVKIILAYNSNATITPSDVSNIQLEEGSSATSYEAFTNIVYGGIIDAVNRVIAVGWIEKVLDGTETWQNMSGQGGNPRYFRTEIGAYGYAESGAIYCDQFVQAIITASTDNIGINATNSTSANKSFISFRPGIEGITTSAGLSSYLAEHPVQTVYKLSTPIEIPIDPITVQTLIGDNTIWSDTGEDMTVTYLKRG